MISQRAKYALHALLALARAQESLMVGEIAASEQIPRKFLRQDFARAEAPWHRPKPARAVRRVWTPDARRPHHLRPSAAHPRRPDRAASLFEPHRLSALRRLSKRRELRGKTRVPRVAEQVRDVLDRTTIADAIRKLSPESEAALNGPRRADVGTLLS